MSEYIVNAIRDYEDGINQILYRAEVKVTEHEHFIIELLRECTSEELLEFAEECEAEEGPRHCWKCYAWKLYNER